MRAWLVLGPLLAACGGAADSRGASDASTGDAACVPGPLALHVLTDGSGASYPAKLYTDVKPAAAPPALFMIDTGSAQTFLRQQLGTQPTANAGVVAIGCTSLALPGYAEADLGTFDGLDVIGSVGLDRLLGGPSLVDIANAQLVIHTAGDPFPDAAAWPSATFDLVQNTLLAHVSLDGNDVRLLVDTGSDHSLWLGQPGQPGDTTITTIDSADDPLTEYLGTGDLAIGGVHTTVPLVRAPSFPYLQEYFDQLGGNIAGLLGLSSFAHAIEIDPAAAVIRIEP